MKADGQGLGTNRLLKRWSLASVVALWLLILAGGLVRGSGSGMGCPDWPKCFNQYIPPTNVSQLPSGYEQKFNASRLAKNLRFSAMLEKMGFHSLATHVRNDKSVMQSTSFNVWNTYTEYINRLIGALTGLILAVTFLVSLRSFKMDPVTGVLCFLNVLLTGVQGWLGSFVVATNLTAWIVTVHMVLALVILGLALYIFVRAGGLKRSFQEGALTQQRALRWIAGLAVLALVIQIVLGSQVRENIDMAAAMTSRKLAWIHMAYSSISIHKVFSLFVFFLLVTIWYVIKKEGRKGSSFAILSIASLVIAGMQIAAGSVMVLWPLPPSLQVVHLFLATLLFSNLVVLYLVSSRSGSL